MLLPFLSHQYFKILQVLYDFFLAKLEKAQTLFLAWDPQ